MKQNFSMTSDTCEFGLSFFVSWFTSNFVNFQEVSGLSCIQQAWVEFLESQ